MCAFSGDLEIESKAKTDTAATYIRINSKQEYLAYSFLFQLTENLTDMPELYLNPKTEKWQF